MALLMLVTPVYLSGLILVLFLPLKKVLKVLEIWALLAQYPTQRGTYYLFSVDGNIIMHDEAHYYFALTDTESEYQSSTWDRITACWSLSGMGQGCSVRDGSIAVRSYHRMAGRRNVVWEKGRIKNPETQQNEIRPGIIRLPARKYQKLSDKQKWAPGGKFFLGLSICIELQGEGSKQNQ